jgi:hypothetical protein
LEQALFQGIPAGIHIGYQKAKIVILPLSFGQNDALKEQKKL